MAFFLFLVNCVSVFKHLQINDYVQFEWMVLLHIFASLPNLV